MTTPTEHVERLRALRNATAGIDESSKKTYLGGAIGYNLLPKCTSEQIESLDYAIACCEASAKREARVQELERYTVHKIRCKYYMVPGAGNCTCGLDTLHAALKEPTND